MTSLLSIQRLIQRRSPHLRMCHMMVIPPYSALALRHPSLMGKRMMTIMHHS
jgi:hypothetical protein